jgi:hypothetical protein
MPKDSKKTSVDPTLQAANTTSRRTLIGVIFTAVLAALAVIAAAVINKGCGANPTPPHFIGRTIDEKTEARIRNAKVSLESESVPSVAYTDSEGIFSFPLSDPNKEIRMRIEADAYENFDLRVTPSKNQGIQDVRLIMKKEKTAELSGTVLDREERPLQGVQVTLDDIIGMKPVETSSDGIFRITDIPRKYGEMVRLRVVKEGYLPYPHTEDITLGKAPPRIKLTRKK